MLVLPRRLTGFISQRFECGSIDNLDLVDVGDRNDPRFGEA